MRKLLVCGSPFGSVFVRLIELNDDRNFACRSIATRNGTDKRPKERIQRTCRHQEYDRKRKRYRSGLTLRRAALTIDRGELSANAEQPARNTP